MRPLYYTLSLFFAIILYACQTEDTLKSGVGYLRLNVNGSNEMQTRAATLPEGYTGKQIAVKIIDKNGKVIKKTDDWELWKDESIELPVGTYTIQAFSYGFDGKQSAVEAPYYYGEEIASIVSGKEANVKVVCKLANVKVSVKLSDNIKPQFKAFDITVKPQETGVCDPITISVDLAGESETKVIYFPVTDLTVQYTLTNQNNDAHSATYDLNGVKGNDHYILNFKLEETGTANDVTVTVDETMQEYKYTFTVSQHPKNNANLTVGAWDRLAYLKAENVTTGTGVSTEGITFQYRIKMTTQTKAGETPWNDVATTVNDNTYTAMLTGLTASTIYEYRLANAEGETIGSVKEFTTSTADAKTELPNGDFEDWCKRSAQTAISKQNTMFPCSDSDYDTNNRFWDTSNRGANSGGSKDPTNKTEDYVHSGSYAAKLGTISILGNLAAASLYTGDFGSASISGTATVNFGKPFTSRPIALHGYYKYTAAKASGTDKLPSNITLENNLDQCAIFIVLMKSENQHEVNNTKTETLLSVENIWENDKFIAYGELPSGASTQEDGLVEFTIPLKYKEQFFTEQPTHIIVVCSASKYGDYMVGGEGSTLYVDDFSLVYDGEPTLWK